MYVIKKGSLYVAKEGLPCSYTKVVKKARKFKTKEEAERNRCPENERVVDLLTDIL